jgi:hypothetical protein
MMNASNLSGYGAPIAFGPASFNRLDNRVEHVEKVCQN